MSFPSQLASYNALHQQQCQQRIETFHSNAFNLSIASQRVYLGGPHISLPGCLVGIKRIQISGEAGYCFIINYQENQVYTIYAQALYRIN